MQALIVLAHPEPRSFNAQLAARAAASLGDAGHAVRIVDLCAEGFDAVERGAHYLSRRDPAAFDAQAEQRHAAEGGTLPADVAAQLEALEAADLLVLQFPMWWFTMPAVLKGWFDRVFVYGRAYTSKRRYDAGAFKGRKALVSVTMGGPEPTFRPDGRNGDIDLLLWPVQFSLHYLGFTVLEPYLVFGVEGGLKYSPEDVVRARLGAALDGIGTAMRELDRRPAVPFNGWGDWTEEGRLKPGAPSYSPFMRPAP